MIAVKTKVLWNPRETQIQNPSAPGHSIWYKSVSVYLVRSDIHMGEIFQSAYSA